MKISQKTAAIIFASLPIIGMAILFTIDDIAEYNIIDQSGCMIKGNWDHDQACPDNENIPFLNQTSLGKLCTIAGCIPGDCLDTDDYSCYRLSPDHKTNYIILIVLLEIFLLTVLSFFFYMAFFDCIRKGDCRLCTCIESPAYSQLEQIEIPPIRETISLSSCITSSEGPSTDCPVCLSNISGEKMTLPCQHSFHSSCLWRSSIENGLSCPLCRRQYDPIA